MKSTVPTEPGEVLKPPLSETGVLGWVKHNLFNGYFNSVLTILILIAAWQLIPPLISWAFIDSVWNTSGAACQEIKGACWSIVPANFRLVIFGFYPIDQQWRPLMAMIILVGLLLYSKNRDHWKKRLLYIWLFALVLMGLLMRGGLFGLVSVESAKWSGLPLTLMLSFFGMVAAYPLGVVLALGRRSKLVGIRSLCVVYIEMIRGVPLISLLFMSSILFPLFLPKDLSIDKILRAQAAIIMFTAAYIAEVVRGGLQAIDKGQYEAAESIGLNYFQSMRLVVLPQALKIVIPPSVGILISAFKDTSLVVIIALYDLLNTTKSALSNPEWMGGSSEIYIFVALIYFVFCYLMSSYSRRLEAELEYKTD